MAILMPGQTSVGHRSSIDFIHNQKRQKEDDGLEYTTANDTFIVAFATKKRKKKQQQIRRRNPRCKQFDRRLVK